MRPLGGAKVGTSCQKWALLIDFFNVQIYVISVWNELGSYNFQALSTATQSTMSFLENADMSQNYTPRWCQTLKKIQIFKHSRSKSQKSLRGNVAPRVPVPTPQIFGVALAQNIDKTFKNCILCSKNFWGWGFPYPYPQTNHTHRLPDPHCLFTMTLLWSYGDE